MKYIDGPLIDKILSDSYPADPGRVGEILTRAKDLKGLTMEETAVLLSAEREEDIKEIFSAAAQVKNAIYGRRVVIFAPLYINNICANYCAYCGFKADNACLKRKKLTQEEIAGEVQHLLKTGHKRILMVASESGSKDDAGYFVESIKTIYAQKFGNNAIRRVNVNCAPLLAEDFRKLKASGIGTYQIFQETYHDATYRKVHPKGPKSDPDNRLDAVDRAIEAGIDDVGVGVLYGLYDHKFETLALLSHIKHLEKKFGVGPHTISIPRIEPAEGATLSYDAPYKVLDGDFKKLVAVLRLAVPYTGIILSTRENASMRDELFNLGVSQISASSSTSPGGYTDKAGNEGPKGQFTLQDDRSLEEVIASLIDRDAIPSFCAACYRSERTGEAFMKLAKPGTIKGKCRINALITFKEYLDDFATGAVKDKGYKLIAEERKKLGVEENKVLEELFADIAKGKRDGYV